MRAGGVPQVPQAVGAAPALGRRTPRGGLRLLRRLAVLSAAGWSAGCAPSAVPTPSPAPATLEAVVDSVMDTPPLDGVHWGVLAVDARTGEEIVSRNADRRFIPASNMKVLTTAAALSVLGPDHRWRTELRAEGLPGPGGRLQGDLVLVSDGDPTLSERFWPDDEAPLRALADSAVAWGLTSVTGRLVVDATRWDSTSVRDAWMVGDLPWRWSATGGAFAVGEGETTVVLRAGTRPGDPARVEAWWPRGQDTFLVGFLETIHPDSSRSLRATWLPQTTQLVLEGGLPAGSLDTVRVATRDPVRQAAAGLHRALEAAGVEVAGGWKVDWTGAEGGAAPAEARVVASLESPPLMEVVRQILEPSQNWLAEQTLRAVGGAWAAAPDDSAAAALPPRASWPRGLLAVRRFLEEEVGVDSLDFRVDDGSGLSVYGVATPRVMVRTLDWAADQPWGPAYRAALAEPGEEDSTLEERLEEYAGRLHAKTGTLTNVVTLSGYLVTDAGRTVTFSIMTNGSGLPSSAVREGMDRIVRALAASRGPVTPPP